VLYDHKRERHRREQSHVLLEQEQRKLRRGSHQRSCQSKVQPLSWKDQKFSCEEYQLRFREKSLHQIDVQQTKTRNLEIFFSGDFSPIRMEGRLDILHQAIQAQEIHKSSLHIKIDMMNNMLSMIELLDQALFQICFFNLYPFKGGYLNLKDMCQIHIEIGNTHQRAHLRQFIDGVFQEDSGREHPRKPSLR
jgi:hypothetical protein